MILLPSCWILFKENGPPFYKDLLPYVSIKIVEAVSSNAIIRPDGLYGSGGMPRAGHTAISQLQKHRSYNSCCHRQVLFVSSYHYGGQMAGVSFIGIVQIN